MTQNDRVTSYTIHCGHKLLSCSLRGGSSRLRGIRASCYQSPLLSHSRFQGRIPHPATGPHRGADWSAPKTSVSIVRVGISIVGALARLVGGRAPGRKVSEWKAVSREKVIVEVVESRRWSIPEIFLPRKSCPGGGRFEWRNSGVRGARQGGSRFSRYRGNGRGQGQRV